MSIGTPEIILCLVIALLVLGPDKLPGAARQVGRVMGEFRRLTTDVQGQVRTYLEEDEQREREADREATAATAAELGSAAAEAEALVPGTPGNAPAPLAPHPNPEGFRLIDEREAPASPSEPGPSGASTDAGGGESEATPFRPLRPAPQPPAKSDHEPDAKS